jgi:thiosulfate/3-mercaptopyruvate sulfurtransferase
MEAEMVINRHSPATHHKLSLCLSLLAMALSFANSVYAQSSTIPPIVSPDWLMQKLLDPAVIVLDIRNAEQYTKGHIPGAINVPQNQWAISKDGLSLELPYEDALRELVGKSGMDAASHVIVVNRIDTDFSRADAARVAWTLHIAGLDHVTILDGGYNRWVKEKKDTVTDTVVPKSGTYIQEMSRASFASKAYVLRRLNKATIVDTRTPEDYFGISSQPGHIKNAVNLPTPWMFENDGTFRKAEDLGAMASSVLGSNKSKEVIVYCGVGGYASAWWFVLTQVLGYRNVKLYDGSMEEWIKDSAAPVRKYGWR